MIRFEPLNENHFPLLTAWFNKPHVQAFYSMHDWTLEEVRSKYLPYVRKEKPVNCFVSYRDEASFAFIQYYAIKDFGWPEQDFEPEIVQKAAGIDLFIGEESMLHKGLGSELLNAFLEAHIWPRYDYCVVDPEERNVASQHFFRKCGFREHKTIHTRDTLERDGFVREVSLVLMVRRKSLKIRRSTLADLPKKTQMKLVPYREEWKADFEKIRKDINDCIGDRIVSIDHIGSTAIPGISAKDIIDVQIGIHNFDDIDSIQKALCNIGFEFLPQIKQDHAPGHEFDDFVPGWDKRFFTASGSRRPANLHVRLVSGKNFEFALRFRDYLRKDSEAARAYEQVKIRLAEYLSHDDMAYSLIKDPVCDLIMLLASGMKPR